jgi:hypothetical protein
MDVEKLSSYVGHRQEGDDPVLVIKFEVVVCDILE